MGRVFIGVLSSLYVYVLLTNCPFSFSVLVNY